jgi:anti-sigma B factor antagonist
MDLEISSSRVEPGTAVLQLSGSVDLVSRDVLVAAVVSALAADDCAEVLVDAGRVSFMDSTGLGALVESRNAAVDQGKQFAVREPSASVARLLELSGLSELLLAE